MKFNMARTGRQIGWAPSHKATSMPQVGCSNFPSAGSWPPSHALRHHDGPALARGAHAAHAHVDPAVAQMSGYEKPILHGLCSLGFAVHAVLNECAGGAAARFKAVRARFAAPVLPGQTLRTKMWRQGAGRVLFEPEVAETGTAAIKHAYVDLHTDQSPPARL